MAKQKKQSSSAEKDAARARKVPRTQARKAARREDQEIRRQTNVVRRHMGTLTPWEASKARRRQKPTQDDLGLAA